MSLGKQAKTLTKGQQDAVLAYLTETRHSTRDRVTFLLSVKAGLRAKEIASLTWGMITDAEGAIAETIGLTDAAAKGSSGGVIYVSKALRDALIELRNELGKVDAADRVFRSERRKVVSAQVIVNLFARWYKALGFEGCSSHSGRRTFITNAARKISTVGGSMRDVQALARHTSLNMTMRYVDCDKQAMRKVVELV